MDLSKRISERYVGPIAFGSITLIILTIVSFYNFLLFHSLAELFSIVVSCGIFMFAWNSRRFMDNGYLFILGVAYLIVGMLDILHMLSYPGMGVFPSGDENLTSQLWVISRYFESLSFIIGYFYIDRRPPSYKLLISYSIAAALFLASIFYWQNFPDCYLPGQGFTFFDHISEVVICTTLLLAAVLLYLKRSRFRTQTYILLNGAIVSTLASEFFFILYDFDQFFLNLFGHMLKIISFYLIYKAIIETGLVRPFNILFDNLQRSERALKREKEFAENLIETAQTIILVLDKEGRIMTFNPFMEELSGYKLAEVKNKNWFDTFVLDNDRAGIRNVYERAMNDNPVRNLIYPIRTKDGKELQIEWNAQPLKNGNGEIVGLITSGQDITQHVQAKKQLLLYADELQKLNANKDKFFHIIAHDLRNPLTSLLGLGDILTSRVSTFPREKIKYYADMIYQSVQNLYNMTENLLQWSRIQTGKFEYSPSSESVEELIRPNVNILRGHAVKKKISIITKLEKNAYAYVDRTMIDSVIQNLISNAIKFTHEGGTIYITSRTRGSHVEIAVADNGIGMSQEKLDSLFKIETHQASYGTAGERGTGLGLLLCKELVEKNHGNIYVKSELNKGTTFLFTIPRSI